MASWSETTKHEPSSINGGQRYEKGNRVPREQLNLITENSFYAINKSNEANTNSTNALAVANNAFEQSKVTGTQVTVGGKFQSTFDADSKANLDASNLTNDNIESWQNKLNNLPNLLDIQNAQSGPVTVGFSGQATVVGCYLSSDGKTWYRLWSDGWKECGVQVDKSGEMQILITLPIAFSNEKFIVNMSANTENYYPTLRTDIQGVDRVYVWAGKSNAGQADYGGTFYVYCCGY